MIRTLLAALVLVLSLPLAALDIGADAPEISLLDTAGATRTLAAFRGQYVVLEWVNFDCPFVRKHYSTGNMQRLQREAVGHGAVWLSIASSAPGKQGHLTAETAKKAIADQQAAPTALLLDPEGTAGKAYAAKTTPHMVLIDPQGKVIYQGAIDDRPSTDAADVPKATNFLRQALNEALAGQPVSVPETKPYGCSVKYAG